MNDLNVFLDNLEEQTEGKVQELEEKKGES